VVERGTSDTTGHSPPISPHPGRGASTHHPPTTLDTFSKKFDTFADTPDAVTKMRELVLRLAFSGGLSSEKSNDENIPTGWELRTIKSICSSMTPGFACSKSHQTEGGHVHLRTHNISTLGTLNFDLLVRIDPKITVRPYSYEKNGIFYTSYLVQGWKEGGKWKKREFKDEEKAKTFAALKEIEIKNKGRAVRMVNTSMDDGQVKEAETAFEKLGKSYSLSDAVEFFLKNHRAPDFTIPFAEGIKIYLDDCEDGGVRPRTITGKKSVRSLFARETRNPLVHKVTAPTIQAFLKSLRAKDGMTPATRKTWNNYRNELNHFFKWAGESDLATHRPWAFSNPAESVRIFSAKQVAEQRSPVAITSPENVQRLLTVLLRWRGGCLAKCFALAYFAGVRPDAELRKLAKREKELINLKTRTIHIPAEVSKTGEARQVTISDSLAAWLEALDEKPIVPTNFDRLMKQARKHLQLSHDETRHSFISYHVALHRSLGDTALQAGNSESIVKKHYLNLRPQEEGGQFFAIVPDITSRRAVILPPAEIAEAKGHLRAI